MEKANEHSLEESLSVPEKLDIFNKYFQRRWPDQNHLVLWTATTKYPLGFSAVKCCYCKKFRKFIVTNDMPDVELDSLVGSIVFHSNLPTQWTESQGSRHVLDCDLLGDTDEEAYCKWLRGIENEFCCEFPCISAMKLWLEIAGEGDEEEK